MISAVTGNRNYHAFSSERINEAWDAWQAHLQQYQVRSAPHVAGTASAPARQWNLRTISPYLASASPMLAGLPSMAGEVANIRQQTLANNRLQAMAGMSRLGKAAGARVKDSRGINEGLHQLFMAQDRYSKARLEARFKEAEAQLEQEKYGFNTSLDDLLNSLNYDFFVAELLSQMLARTEQASRTIIGNI